MFTDSAIRAHARRKFYDARNSDAATSMHALAHIRLLYDVEDGAKQRVATLARERTSPDDDAAPASANPSSVRIANDLSAQAGRATWPSQGRAELIRSLRQEKSVPRVEQFKAWLESQQAAGGGPVLPKSPMGPGHYLCAESMGRAVRLHH